MDEDEYGAISAHTCSRELNIPHKSFSIDNEDTYNMFSMSLMAVIDGNTFNII